MRNAVRSALIGERGRLRVGFVVSATLELLPRLLIAYRARYPQIELKLEESRTADLLEDVGQGRIDLAIVRTPVMQRAGVMIEQLQSDTLCLAVPKGSKWSGRKRVDLGELRDEPFVVFSRERVPNMHAITMLMCQREGFVPIVAEEAGQLQTILCLVESGIGVALVPGVAARQAGGFELLSIGISPDDTAIGLSMVTRVGEISAATQNFRTIAREVCGSAS
jgi:DNA-binding transcriptional LysR family regulator